MAVHGRMLMALLPSLLQLIQVPDFVFNKVLDIHTRLLNYH